MAMSTESFDAVTLCKQSVAYFKSASTIARFCFPEIAFLAMISQVYLGPFLLDMSTSFSSFLSLGPSSLFFCLALQKVLVF